ncbi:MAG: hypothetical protein SF028_11970 [Candidatus Sumerlaeia bacterium]|nr:hypothetical protein [Candidatus Sumerlaeia bacterium]
MNRIRLIAAALMLATGSPHWCAADPSPATQAPAPATAEDVVITYWRAFASKDATLLKQISPDANAEDFLAMASRYAPSGAPEILDRGKHPEAEGVELLLVAVPFGAYTYNCAMAVAKDASGRTVLRQDLSFWELGEGDSLKKALKSRDARVEAAKAARKAADSLGEAYPKSAEGVIRAFWRAASEKDYDTMAIFAPGSLRDDFAKWYDTFTPRPAEKVGSPQPHPTAPGVELYPVRVPFPGFPEKTIKMAVSKDEAGRFVIDGANSIWW